MKARRAVKRYKAHVEKHGACAVCKHRNRTETYFGRSVCRVGQTRTINECQSDGKGVKFELDEAVLEQFRDAA